MVKRPNVELARNLRRRMTDAELALWRHLRGRQFLGWKFRRQHAINAYIVDFVCLDARLIVELDGGQHMAAAKADAARSRVLERCGYRVLRFWNDAVFKETDRVLRTILSALETQPPHPGPLPGGERGKVACGG